MRMSSITGLCLQVFGAEVLILALIMSPGIAESSYRGPTFDAAVFFSAVLMSAGSSLLMGYYSRRAWVAIIPNAVLFLGVTVLMYLPSVLRFVAPMRGSLHTSAVLMFVTPTAISFAAMFGCIGVRIGVLSDRYIASARQIQERSIKRAAFVTALSVVVLIAEACAFTILDQLLARRALISHPDFAIAHLETLSAMFLMSGGLSFVLGYYSRLAWVPIIPNAVLFVGLAVLMRTSPMLSFMAPTAIGAAAMFGWIGAQLACFSIGRKEEFVCQSL